MGVETAHGNGGGGATELETDRGPCGARRPGELDELEILYPGGTRGLAILALAAGVGQEFHLAVHAGVVERQRHNVGRLARVFGPKVDRHV